MDDAARDKFDELLRSLQQQVLDSSFRELSQRLGSIDSGQMAALKEMVRELNQLLEAHLEGGDAASRALFDRFMQKYGEQFGPNPPGSPDELVDSLLDQMAQLESLLGSLSPGVRNELEETLASAFRDDALQDEMALLASNLRDIRPDGLDNLFRFGGNEPLGLEEALEVMGQLQKLEGAGAPAQEGPAGTPPGQCQWRASAGCVGRRDLPGAGAAKENDRGP